MRLEHRELRTFLCAYMQIVLLARLLILSLVRPTMSIGFVIYLLRVSTNWITKSSYKVRNVCDLWILVLQCDQKSPLAMWESLNSMHARYLVLHNWKACGGLDNIKFDSCLCTQILQGTRSLPCPHPHTQHIKLKNVLLCTCLVCIFCLSRTYLVELKPCENEACSKVRFIARCKCVYERTRSSTCVLMADDIVFRKYLGMVYILKGIKAEPWKHDYDPHTKHARKRWNTLRSWN